MLLEWRTVWLMEVWRRSFLHAFYNFWRPRASLDSLLNCSSGSVTATFLFSCNHNIFFLMNLFPLSLLWNNVITLCLLRMKKKSFLLSNSWGHLYNQLFLWDNILPDSTDKNANLLGECIILLTNIGYKWWIVC